MSSKLKQTIKSTAIYSLGNISTKLIGFILLPLYTSYLSTQEYGTFAILEITGVIMVAVFGLRLSTTMMRWNSSTVSKKKEGAILFTTYLTSFFIIVLLNSILHPLSGRFSQLFFNTTDFSKYFTILFISVSFEILNVFSFDLLRLKEKPEYFVLVSILRVVTVLMLNIYFVKIMQKGVVGIILSQMIGNILVTVITLPFLLKNMKPVFYTSEIKSMLKYGIPLVFSSISMMLLTMSDRYIIKYFLSYSEVGIYALGYKIASVLNMLLVQSFQTGFLPIAYKNYDKPDAQHFFSKTLSYYSLVLVFAALGLSLFSEELIILFSNNVAYNSALKIIPLISLAFIFKGIQFFFSLGLHFIKKTKYNALIVLSSALLNIILNFLLIPWIGLYGAALATVFSWVFLTIFFYKVSGHFYKIKYEMKKLIILLIIGVSMFLLSFLVSDFSFYHKIGIKCVLVVIFPISLIIFGYFEKKEILRLKNFIANTTKFFRNKNNN